MACQGHKVNDILSAIRFLSPRELENNRLRPLALWRGSRKSLCQAFEDEAEKCGLILGPVRWRRGRFEGKYFIRGVVRVVAMSPIEPRPLRA